MLAPTIEPVRVRLAGPEDEQDLVAMCRLLHKESGIRDKANQPLRFCEEKVRGIVQRAIIRNRNSDEEFMVCGIIGEPGDLQASIGIGVDQPWYTDQYHLMEVWNFVHPEHRKSGHAKALMSFSKTLSDFMGETLMMGIMSNNRVEAKERFYQRMLGVERFGGYFLYQPAMAAGG